MSKPHDEGSPGGHLFLALQQHEHVLLLALFLEAYISPVADESSQSSSFFALGESSQYV